MKYATRYEVLAKAREVTGIDALDILELRKYLGVPLASDIRRWLTEQPATCLLCIDLCGVRAANLSVAEELGPLLMQTVHQSPELEHRYPIYRLPGPEPAYTFHRAFANANWAALAVVDEPGELLSLPFVLRRDKNESLVVLGQLSPQMQKILLLAEDRSSTGKSLTSEDLSTLDFLADVSPAARSKRLTELHARRLLAFRDNPRNQKERLFLAPWWL